MDAFGHRPLHLLAQLLHRGRIHALAHQGPLREQLLQVALVHRSVELQL